MPCATIHMFTAGRILDAWDRRPERAPFAVRRAPLRQAFLAGAMGPDMGFVPGIDRLVSELSHYVSSGALARRILREATSPVQTAFAWGWATHHVTDVEVHPLVGRACGEHVLGDRSIRLNSSADLESHVAMEVGLDLFFLLEDPDIPRPPDTPAFDVETVDFLARALEGTYRIGWDRRRLFRSHGKAVSRTARWPDMLGFLGRARGLAPDGASEGWMTATLGRLLDVTAQLLPTSGAPVGFLRPLSPPAWLVRRVREVGRTFPERFQSLVQDRLEGLENRNLETGKPEDAPVDHPDSRSTLQRLRRLQRRQEARQSSGPSPVSSRPPSSSAAAERA